MKRYPLAPLSTLRAKEVDDASRGLAGALRVRQEAERVERSNRAARDEAAARARVTREGEKQKLERGELRAADLAQAVGWARKVDGEQAALEQRVARAADRTEMAREREDEARSEVSQARAEEEVVERDRARWEASERRLAEAKGEEDAADAWRRRE